MTPDSPEGEAMSASGTLLTQQLREADAALNGTLLAKLAHGEGTPEMVKLIVRLKCVAQEAAAELAAREEK